MLNVITLVGRIVELPKEIEEGEKVIMIMSVPRSYKNENGEYETDIIPVNLIGGVAKNTLEYCKKGDLVGVKGRVQIKDFQITIIAEKLTFLSTNKDLINKD